MKRSTKIITIVTSFFLIIAIVITARTMIGNHFKKKFSKIPPPGIIVTNVIIDQFSEKLETFGTAISNKNKTFKIRKDDVQGELNLKNKVKKGDLILNLKSGSILAPFDGVLGYFYHWWQLGIGHIFPFKIIKSWRKSLANFYFLDSSF